MSASVRSFAFAVLLLALTAPPAAAQRVLFDAAHGETAGNADWIVDADSTEILYPNFQCQNPRLHSSGQRFPTPPQDQVTLDTPETFWRGGVSAWALDLAKDALDPTRGRDWTIEQYAFDADEMTFGDPSNPQDLSNYDVLILVEPNDPFTDAENQAILEFVLSGGGLFLVADHDTSDRNCSGFDSPAIFNRLLATDIETQSVVPFWDPTSVDNDFGLAGIWFYENDNDDKGDQNNEDFDWFTEAKNDNVVDTPDDPILHGPFGDGTGGLGFFGSTQMAVSTHPDRGNPTARVHILRNDASGATNGAGVVERVTLASARLGAGRIIAIGDSSPADDGTGHGNLHDGWDKADHGVANDVLHLNATEWLADPQPDETAPTITAGPSVAAEDCSGLVTWITDEPGTSVVRFGEVDLDRTAETPGLTTGHQVRLEALEPATTYRLRVASADAAGNGPTESPEATFTTLATIPLAVLSVPSVASVADLGAEMATLHVRLSKVATVTAVARADGLPDVSATAPAGVAATWVFESLEPATTYAVTSTATDACGTVLALPDVSFTTAERPPERDLSGFRLVNDKSPEKSVLLPEGTRVPTGGGVLVIGRSADRESFESEWGALPEGVVYVDGGDGLVINKTLRAYTLLDGDGQVVEGPTAVTLSGKTLERRAGCPPAGAEGSWEVSDRRDATPGVAGVVEESALAGCSGVLISEMSDAGDFRHEFVEVVVLD